MTVIEEYIATAPLDRQEQLTKLYQFIKGIIPEAEERISYGMPTFFLKQNLVYFANTKKHIGFYPTNTPIVVFENDLTDFKTTKGSIHLPVDQELPYELIHKIVLFRLDEVQQKYSK